MRAEFVTTLAGLDTRFSVKEVISPQQVSGLLLSGELRLGDVITIAPDTVQTAITAIHVNDENVPRIQAPAEASLSFVKALSAEQGDLISHLDEVPPIADQFSATLHWLSTNPLLPGRIYTLLAAHRAVAASISRLNFRISRTGSEQLPASALEKGESGSCNIFMQRPITFDLINANPITGKFELVDRETGATVARGAIDAYLAHANRVQWHPTTLSQVQRAALKEQAPRVIWLTGLPASGKSTVANLLEQKLHAQNRHTYLLEGSNVRMGLNKDLGFSDADRVENVRRMAAVAHLMLDAGLIVIVSSISPFKAEREMARELFADGEFIEVYLDASAEQCAQRDTKDLYARAGRGEISNFVGVDSPYEIPVKPELQLDAGSLSAEQISEQILHYLNT